MSGVGVRVSREGPGLALPTSLSGTVGSVTGDDIDWVDGGGAPGSITGSGDFELKNEGGQDYIKVHGSLGAAATFDPTDGNVHTGTLTANCTFTLDAPTGTGFCSLEFWLTQDGTGGWSVTWPGSVTVVGTPDTTLSTTSRVVVETVDGGTTWIATWVGASSASSLPWFTVTDYGATGNGSTDDTAAINLAIAAMNTATKGVLYFPAGTYKATAGLTTITASGIVMGDGMGAYDGSAYVSAVLCTSQTANLFTVTGKTLEFRDIGLFNTYGGTASAGSGIHVNGSFIGQKVDLTNVVVAHFYDNVVRDVGAQWANVNVWNWGAVRYGESIQNTVNQDAGDWSILGSYYYADTNNGTAAIYQTGAGGGKIAATKLNGGTAKYATGIDLAIGTSHATSILLLSGVSIENVSGDAVRLTTTGSGTFYSLHVVGCQVGLFSNNTGRAVKVSAASAGGIGVAGGISAVVIDGSSFRTDGTARAAVELVNTDGAVLGEIALLGFNARYTSSGDTNTTDMTGVPSFATPSIVLGTAAAAGAATTVIRSDATIVAFDATAPVTQAFGDAAATGSAAVAAHRDHKHGMPATPSTASQHILLADGHATPFAFTDLLQMDDGSDFMWSDPE